MVVNAGGLWARESARWRALFPAAPEWSIKYIVYRRSARDFERDMSTPHRDGPAGESYLRQEGRGLVHRLLTSNPARPLGCGMARRGTSAHELLPDNLDKIEE